ncbi:MAG: hypothetical protein MJ211_03960 [Bacteroidales bacterium]|nr:hypothetical protein [Bacteroidales bacterium]
MRKVIFILLAIVSLNLCSTKNSNAQIFGVGNLGLNFGFGAGNADYTNHNGIFVPTFNFALDYGFLGNIINGKGAISGGGYFGIGQGSEKYSDGKLQDARWRIGTRGALHYQFVENLDTYGCVNVGYRHDKFKWDGISNNASDGKFEIFPSAGVRYMFGNCGVYSELTWNEFAWFQIGLTFIL